MKLTSKIGSPTPWHTALVVEFGGPLRTYCGDTWCNGACDLPALVVTLPDRVLKAYGEQVACGCVMSPFRVRWMGATVEATADETEALMRRWWM